MAGTERQPRRDPPRLLWGGVLLGLGIGGFFDGIVLHQVLQWHHMLSNRYPVTTLAGLEINTLGDGFFHIGAYLFTLIGLALLWSAVRWGHVPWSPRRFVGTLLIGWGLFNLLEGFIDHHLLQLHHVRPGPDELAWDLAFLAWGAVMLAVGWLLLSSGKRERVE